MKPTHAAMLSLLLLPFATMAQELPSSGANDEGLGKDTVIKLSSALSSHSDVRRASFEDQISVSALRYGPGEGTVWVYRTNEIIGKTGYQHFAIRVHMRQIAPGNVEFKTQVFCDLGSDRYLNISANRCDAVKQLAPKLVDARRQDFIMFIGGENTTPAQIKAAAGEIHNDLAARIGAPGASTSSGRTDQAPGQID